MANSGICNSCLKSTAKSFAYAEFDCGTKCCLNCLLSACNPKKTFAIRCVKDKFTVTCMESCKTCKVPQELRLHYSAEFSAECTAHVEISLRNLALLRHYEQQAEDAFRDAETRARIKLEKQNEDFFNEVRKLAGMRVFRVVRLVDEVLLRVRKDNYKEEREKLRELLDGIKDMIRMRR